jgi:hypothetical protein
MLDAGAMNTGIVTDHNADPDEYMWWRIEKPHDLFHVSGGYTPLFEYERSVRRDLSGLPGQLRVRRRATRRVARLPRQLARAVSSRRILLERPC